MFDNLKKALGNFNPDAVLIDGYEEAMVGILFYDQDMKTPPVAVYDYSLMVKTLVERDGMDEDEAVEHIDFNTFGALPNITKHKPRILMDV